jgi:hypothetical protein
MMRYSYQNSKVIGLKKGLLVHTHTHRYGTITISFLIK